MSDMCVKCGICEMVCPSRLSALRAIDLERSGVTVNESVACTTCNLCVASCPMGVQITKAIERMRESMTTKGYAETLFNIENHGCSIVMDNPFKAKKKKCRTAYFAGCLTCYRQRDIGEAIEYTLDRMGIDFTRIDEVCCGSPLNRIGRFDLSKKTLEKNLSQLRELGVERVITNCPGCTSTFLEYQDEFSVVHYLDLYEQEGVERMLRPREMKTTLQYPCHLYRNVSPYTMVVAERVLAAMSDYERMPFPDSCCGAGGGVRRNDLYLSRDLKQRKVKDILAMKADVIASACPQCNIHLSEDLTDVVDLSILVANNLKSVNQ